MSMCNFNPIEKIIQLSIKSRSYTSYFREEMMNYNLFDNTNSQAGCPLQSAIEASTQAQTPSNYHTYQQQPQHYSQEACYGSILHEGSEGRETETVVERFSANNENNRVADPSSEVSAVAGGSSANGRNTSEQLMRKIVVQRAVGIPKQRIFSHKLQRGPQQPHQQVLYSSPPSSNPQIRPSHNVQVTYPEISYAPCSSSFNASTIQSASSEVLNELFTPCLSSGATEEEKKKKKKKKKTKNSGPVDHSEDEEEGVQEESLRLLESLCTTMNHRGPPIQLEATATEVESIQAESDSRNLPLLESGDSNVNLHKPQASCSASSIPTVRSVRRKYPILSGQIEKRTLMTKKEKDQEINLTRKRIIIGSELNRRVKLIKAQELEYLETFMLPVKDDLGLMKEREEIRNDIQRQIEASLNKLNEFKNSFSS